jgi:hypothetical protein
VSDPKRIIRTQRQLTRELLVVVTNLTPEEKAAWRLTLIVFANKSK